MSVNWYGGDVEGWRDRGFTTKVCHCSNWVKEFLKRILFGRFKHVFVFLIF